MDLAIRNLQTRIRLNTPAIRTLARAILRANGVRQGELSLTFVTRQKIQALNKKFLKRNYATDVLAFDLRGSRRFGKDRIMADVVISADAAAQSSCQLATELHEELGLYIIHGILHLCGYDDHGRAPTQRMRRREKEMCSKFKNQIVKITSRSL